MLIDTVDGSILCDPWFIPAFFGSWFVFPRNDQLSDELVARIESADFLYISHLHGDHFDEPWLANHISRDTTVLIPGYPTRELERRIRALGFNNIIRTVDTEPTALGPNVTVAIHVETSITDGPGGDSALVVSDGSVRIVNQNDCRTTDLNALRSHGPVDLHWLQYSGAIWYPMVYDEPADRMRELVDAKVDSQYTRAMRYVEALDARAVVPSAGPPCFLDPDLAHLNMVTGDELSIFPDQRAFLASLAACGRSGVLAIPGTTIEISPQAITVEHPMAVEQVDAIFTDKASYLANYHADWAGWLQQQRAGWNAPTTDLLSTLQAWWQPLLAMAPTLRANINNVCVIHTGDLSVAIDFTTGTVLPYTDQHHAFSFTIQRELVETVVAQRAVDWSNALFLSCRFRAWRAGPFNEYLYNFFKSLSVERMRRAEAEAQRKMDPNRQEMVAEDIRIGDYIVQRACPHRQADLTVFGEIDGDHLVCTLHGWRFDLSTGACLTADDRPIRVRRAVTD